MISLGLKLGVLNDGLSDAGLLELGQYVAGHVSQGSGGAVLLTPQPPVKLPSAVPSGLACSALRLHQGLAQLLGGTTNVPVTNIGLLLAHSYAPAPGIFGLMFDLGFKTPEDASGGLFTKVPRQGCAVFLDAIGAARTGADYSSQVGFTSVHEVGHIFNLTHQSHPVTFMAPSRPEGPYGPEAYFFGASHRKWLARCGVDPDVTPGGNPFRDQGYGDPGAAPSPTTDLNLAISLSSSSFWSFEPVMLNVSLNLKGRAKKVSVPAELDPGYTRFRICIESPTCNRRLYRSPFRFCSKSSPLEVTADKPFARDIAVFGQAGGFTFYESGMHRLWVEFDVTRRTLLRSNVCEFEVLAPQPRSRDFRTLKTTVGSASAAKSLFYREGSHSELTALADAIDASGTIDTKAMTKYLCVRAILASSTTSSKTGQRWAERELQRALEYGLPRHQEARALQSLDQLQSV